MWMIMQRCGEARRERCFLSTQQQQQPARRTTIVFSLVACGIFHAWALGSLLLLFLQLCNIRRRNSASMVIMATTSSNSSVASSLKISQACESGKKFAQVFYEKLDKNRHNLGQLFHDNATLVWNGNQVKSRSSILEFYSNLPTTETSLICIDAQPVSGMVAPDKTSIIISCNGKMNFKGKTHCFNESFTLTAENNVWKCITDNYRNY